MSDFTPKLQQLGDNTPYLNPREATTWFYADHPLPEGRILTALVSAEPIIVRAEVYVGDALVATAHANPDGKAVTMRRIETAAIRRALANAGYGTEQARRRYVQSVADQIPTDEAKARLGSGGERRIGGEPAANGEQPPRNPYSRGGSSSTVKRV